MQSPAALPTTVFSTEPLTGEDRFSAWRESISVLFDVAPHSKCEEPGFAASVDATHLGEVLVGKLRFDGQQFSRSRPRIARDGLDHYLVQAYRKGGFVGQIDEGAGEISVGAGDIVIFDLRRSQHTYARASEQLTLVLPRMLLDQQLGSESESLHGTVLSSREALGGILSDHLDSLERRLPTLSPQHVAPVVQATAQMVAACAKPSLAKKSAPVNGVSRLQAAPPEVLTECIQRHIGQHLSEPLTADSLCQTFGISRATLYRLFKPYEGVSHYIQLRRLRRAYYEVASPRSSRLGVGEIAARVGFVSEAHFSRAFRAEFGMRPSDVRQLVKRPGTSLQPRSPVSAEYAQWVRHLAV